MLSNIHIGTAGWTLPKQHAHHFAAEGSHLERHASMLNCVEINSSFYRPHMLKTWQRWAASTPANYRFSVKLPKTITHTAKLNNTGALLQVFLDQVQGLGKKLGPLLVQLPPSLAFDEATAHDFFTTLRELHPTSETHRKSHRPRTTSRHLVHAHRRPPATRLRHRPRRRRSTPGLTRPPRVPQAIAAWPTIVSTAPHAPTTPTTPKPPSPPWPKPSAPHRPPPSSG